MLPLILSPFPDWSSSAPWCPGSTPDGRFRIRIDDIFVLILTFALTLECAEIAQSQRKADVWKSTTCSALMWKMLAVKNRPGFIDLDQPENSQTGFYSW